VVENTAVGAEIYPNPTRDDIKVECAGMQRIHLNICDKILKTNSIILTK